MRPESAPHRILVAEDLVPGTRRSRAVRATSASLAQALGSEIDLAHVDTRLAEHPARLEALARSLKPRARALFRADLPAAGLLALARSGRPRYELLVLGTQGRKGVSRLLLGSVAEDVIRQSPVPVLIVGPGCRPRNFRIHRGGTLLFATDLGPASRPARKAAMRLALQLHARVEILHCLYEGLHPLLQTAFAAPSAGRELMGLYNDLSRSALAAMEREVGLFERAGISCSSVTDTRALVASTAVLREVNARSPSLVVLGTHSRGLIQGAVLGRTVRDVILQSPVPVVVIGSPSAGVTGRDRGTPNPGRH